MSSLPAAGSPAAAWLQGRAAAAWAAVDRAPSAWASWAESALKVGDVGAALARVPAGAPVEGDWDRTRSKSLRAQLGQVFTPAALAGLLADALGAGERERSWPSSLVLDPACGDGSLLLAVCARRRDAGWSVAQALAAVEGWDRDPVAAWLCAARLVEWALSEPVGDVPGPLRVFGGVDALSLTGRPGLLHQRRAPFHHGVGAVIANPPYLEAKRMRKAEPGLKERLRERFPQLSGAFDLYLAFSWLALEQVGEGGEVALLVPNKVCQGRYATPFRRALLAPGSPQLTRLLDASRLQPRPFPGTSVYPVVLGIRKAAEPSTIACRRLLTAAEMTEVSPSIQVGPADLAAVGGELPLFVPFDTWPDLAPLLALERLGEVARLVSTCSFHKRGLREQYVYPEQPELHPSHPYLGLKSRARRTEVAPFEVRWEGGWIHYDQSTLKQAHGNPLPDLERTFLRPKVLWCQHALRMSAVADPDGCWVSKDTYPVGWPVHPDVTLFELLALLNSTVFTALYNTLFQGIVVGGETYHYLPAFLNMVPVPKPATEAWREAGTTARKLNRDSGGVDPVLWEAMDRSVADAYGVSEAARLRMVQTHLVRVGARSPMVG